MISNFFYFNNSVKNFVEIVGKVCTHELTICALGLVVVVGIPLFSK